MERLRTWKIPLPGGGKVTAKYRPADGRVGMLLAHGAGVGQDAPFMVSMRDGLAAAGYGVMTFNYPYMEAGRRAPNRMPVLLDCHRTAFERLSLNHDAVILSGKSMGGRMASHIAAEGIGDGLVVFGYPLVPFGKGEARSTDHFKAIRQPTLFVQGSRDALGPLDKIRPRLRKISNAAIHVIPDADHSFRVPRRSHKSQSEIMQELIDITATWISDHL
ncbi:MAG: alpha/beta hydrolase [Acidimicrobiia bacterium]|nr:alpha/beta hydrolase [Acidimicrobiia bacterium]